MIHNNTTNNTDHNLSKQALAGILFAIVLLALGMRIFHLSIIQRHDFFSIPEMTPDAGNNHKWALQGPQIRQTTENRPYYVAPFYMEALRLLYSLVGARPVFAMAIQFLLGSFSPLLIYWVARMFCSQRASILAAFLCAVNPLYIFYEGTLTKASISVFVVTLAMGVVLVASNSEKRRWLWWLLSGFLMGIVSLIRPNVLLFVPLAGLIILWSGRQLRLRVNMLDSIVWLLGVAIAIAPVTLRNFIVSHDRVLISSNGGFSLYVGNHSGAEAYYQPVPNVSDTIAGEAADTKRIAEKALQRKLKASEVSRFFCVQSLSAIKNDFAGFLRRLARKTLLVFNEVEIPHTENFYLMREFSPALRVPLVGYGSLLPFAIVGLFISRGVRPAWSFINLFILSNVVGLIIFYVSGRYRLPITPFVLIYASIGLVWMWNVAKSKRFRQLIATIIVVTATYMICHLNLVGHFKTDFSVPLFNAAKYYIAQGQTEKAINLLKQIEDTWGARAEVSEAMGRCHINNRQYTEAGSHLNQAIHMASDRFSGYFHRGRLRIVQNQLNATTEDFQRVLAMNDAVPEAYYYLGAIYRQQGYLGKAQEALEEANRLDPFVIPVYAELACLYADQGKTEKARQILEQGLTMAPQDTRLKKLNLRLQRSKDTSR